jgi:CubicO group peptidase (beta-lactamase class C family)
VGERLPATPGTVYDIASVTKSFTAAAVLQLEEQGMLSLEDPVDKFIPEFHIKPFGETIKIKHLLTHSSGIPGLGSSTRMKGSILGTRDDLMPIVEFEDYLTFMRDAQEWAVARPGERFLYSNEGYALLGYLVQLCAGIPFTEYVKNNILEPLGMTRSYFNKVEVEADPDVATLHAINTEGHRVPMPYPFGRVNSHSGLISNADDLMRFVSMCINRGEYEGARVLSAQSVEAMLTPRIPTGSSREMSYGYGFDLIPDFFGHKLAGHGGWIDISAAYVGFVPEKRLGAVVLMNGAGYLPDFIAMYGLAMLLGENPDSLPFIVRDRMLEELTGTYKTYMDTIGAQVKRMGGFLMLELRYEDHRRMTVPLIPDTLTENHRLFYTMFLTVRSDVEFTVKNGRIELNYQRWLFRKDKS